MQGHGLEAVEGLSKVNTLDLGALHGNHLAPLLVVNHIDNLDAQAGAAVLCVVDGGDTDADGNPATSQYAAAQTVIVAPDAGQVAGRRNMGDFLR